MPELVPFSDVAYAIFAAVLLVAIVATVRSRRLRKWKMLLEGPASDVAVLRAKRRKPSWVKSLPPRLHLDSKHPLFEALYSHYRTEPEEFAPQAIQLALRAIAQAEAKKINEGAPRIGGKISDEEKIGSLMSAPTDFETAVPADAFAQNLVLNLVNVLKGRKKLTLGLEHALWDTLGAGGGFAGAKIGGALGVAVAPLVIGASTAFLPVWVLVGAWLGSLAGKKVGSRFKARRYFSAAKKLRKTSRAFKRWFLDQFPAFLAELDREFGKAAENAGALRRDHRSRWLRFFWPDLMSTFFEMSLVRLKADAAAERRRFLEMRAEVRALDPIRFASILERLDPKSARAYPELVEYHRAYREALDELREVDALLRPPPPPPNQKTA
jgi:hypothetical protein